MTPGARKSSGKISRMRFERADCIVDADNWIRDANRVSVCVKANASLKRSIQGVFWHLSSALLRRSAATPHVVPVVNLGSGNEVVGIDTAPIVAGVP